MPQQFWLFKSEPDVFSLRDLQTSPKKTTCWDGVRNYQARNLLRDKMRIGDGVLYYHSRIEPMTVAGTATIVHAGYPDPSQFNAKHKYFDADSPPDAPRWYAVDLRYASTFATPVTRDALRQVPTLEDMMLLRRGSRLSVQPVTASQWRTICALGNKRP